MSKKARLITCLMLLPLLIAAGWYLTLFLAHVVAYKNVTAINWNWQVLIEFWKARSTPQWAPILSWLNAAFGIGFGLPLLTWIFLLFKSLQNDHSDLHGDARFAHSGDLSAKGFFKTTPRTIVVGKFKGKTLRFDGQQFVILAAPTRSGKGVGVVIPNLLEYEESAVVLDIKQENYTLTSGWRQSQGQDIYLFNPFAEDRRGHRWNPLSYVSNDPAFRVSDLMTIAAMLYPDGDERNRFFISQGRNAFMAFALYLFDQQEDFNRHTNPDSYSATPTLGQIYRISTGSGGELKTYLERLSQAKFLSRDAKSAFDNLLSQQKETFASIIGTFKEPLNMWLNPILDAATSGDDFRLEDVRKKKMTIYIGIQPNKLAESRLIVNLFFNQLINVNTKELPQNNPALKYQCLLLMDEFTAIGKVDIIASAVSYMAGYNVRLLPIIQSMAQLDAVYGHEVSRTIITNHALQIVFTPREQRDANDYSEMLGTTTIKRQQISRGREVNRSEVIEKRALMLPQELKAMSADKQIFFFEGIAQPVMCDKIRYYNDSFYKKRLLPKAEIKLLEI